MTPEEKQRIEEIREAGVAELSHCALCEDPCFLYRDCVLHAATSMRSACVEKVKVQEQRYREDAGLANNSDDNVNMLILLHKASAAIEIIRALESLSIEKDSTTGEL